MRSKNMVSKILRGIAIAFSLVVLAGSLTACGVGTPPKAQIEQAIAQQLDQTQQQLGQQLYLDQAPDYKVSHIAVKNRTPLLIQELPAYKVEGTYDLTVDFGDRRLTQENNLFQVYLQQVSEKTWQPISPPAVE